MGLFKSRENKGAATEKIVAEKIVTLFNERTAVETIELKLTRATGAPRESKLGGVPYLPGGFPYPLDRREGREHVPLRFLAQLNFGEMPALEGFPGRGILQFYTGDDEQRGMDHETLIAQKGFRVIYHEDPSADAVPPAMPVEESPDGFPFDGEARIGFEKKTAVMGAGDFRFDALFLQYYNEVTRGAARSLDRVPERVLDEVYARVSTGGHRVGGYPAFARLDPREYHDHARGHTTLLLQLDPGTTGGDCIAWRDGGSYHFFARPDDLAAREFIEVLYCWDC
ncbi:MAG: DUF1963 domain-containing protein [Odoribacteraceae bacterium]|jgi:uncharacterized protein YwqG|nr:DUF1963 domain-containing protein [Odoribacteraceae bacterium]